MENQLELRLEHIYTAYDKADVLSDVSIRVAPGKVTCILGSNGSGKTTLIRSILSLTPPRAGRVMLGDREITGLATHRINHAGIACIPEGRRVFPKMTVRENLRIGAYRERDPAVIQERMAQVFEIFPRLSEREAQLGGTMSGGEQAMLSIGRGLMSAPGIMLIDEPSLGLSPLFVKETFSVIERINALGVTVLLVEQNVHQTLAVAHYGYVLMQGRVVAEGPTESLRDNTEVQQAYFG
ncbi:ABC transporter ATP-binding protein [Castellaniella sp. S9]|uniref:ABC transporter ATP-binding protein n=1 Tax=Castellaniella sp. S9 TaxID=2993652 RepID=UPI0022B4267B|nr:ABC transporter ATP-binding protein [Castellaniella sp. S9]